MVFNEFVKLTKSGVENYLFGIQKLLLAGNLSSPVGNVLFPTILMVSDCNGRYVAELVGAAREFSGLKLKTVKERSVYRYLSQFDDGRGGSVEEGSMMNYSGKFGGCWNVCFTDTGNLEKVSDRFPLIERYKARLLGAGERGHAYFCEDFVYTSFSDCLFVNAREGVVRCKSVLALFVVKSGISKDILFEMYDNYFRGPEVRGVFNVGHEESERILVAAQLKSLYLFKRVHETTIGDFINAHPEIIYRAFSSEHFLYEPTFKWCEHDGTCEDNSINPDFLVRREDGGYDIYDLKTALLSKRSVTRKYRRRRRFIDCVSDGIAQLANYEEYFKYPLNVAHVKEKYGVEVVSPRLVLVVGNWENTSAEEVRQASRVCRDNLSIIDYDTMCRMFIEKGKGG